MRIRLRAPNGTHTLTLEDIATVGDLVGEILIKSSIKGDFSIRHGFPPKVLELPSKDTLLIDLHVALNGEQLIVAEDVSSSKTTPGPSSGPLSNSSGTPFKVEERQQSTSTSTSTSSKAGPTKPNFFSSAPSPNKYEKVKGNEPILRVQNNPGWSATLRVMEDDNSCMFRAVNYAFGRGIDMMTELRSIVASVIQADGELPPGDQRFSDGILGMSRQKYCQRIQHPEAWGGYIELQILAEYFAMTICSIDVETGRVDRYNNGKSNYGILVYSGIHYDCIAASPNIDDPDLDVTVFDSHDPNVLETASKLCLILKERNYATNTNTFRIRCTDCGKILNGEKGAQKHNDQTGHTGFEQVE